MQWTYNQNRDQSVAGESYQPTQSNFVLQRRLAENNRAGVGHDYRVLDLPAVEGVPADSNGHVHQLGVGWRADTHRRRYELTASLAVSSNALKHPSDLQAEDVRFAGAIEQRLGESGRVALRADDRFGRFRLYPGFELFLQPTPAHEVRLGFPESSWRWQWTPPLQSEFAIAPDGGRWRVRDPTLERHSIVQLSSWRATLSLHWQPFDALRVKTQVGRVFETALRYQLRDSSQTRVIHLTRPFSVSLSVQGFEFVVSQRARCLIGVTVPNSNDCATFGLKRLRSPLHQRHVQLTQLHKGDADPSRLSLNTATKS